MLKRQDYLRIELLQLYQNLENLKISEKDLKIQMSVSLVLEHMAAFHAYFVLSSFKGEIWENTNFDWNYIYRLSNFQRKT